MDQIGYTQDFLIKNPIRKKAVMPLYENKNFREYVDGVGVFVNKGADSPPDMHKNKKIFPQSYGMSLGTHGVSYQFMKQR